MLPTSESYLWTMLLYILTSANENLMRVGVGSISVHMPVEDSRCAQRAASPVVRLSPHKNLGDTAEEPRVPMSHCCRQISKGGGQSLGAIKPGQA